MKCPYCGDEMIKGKVCAIGGHGPAMYWRDDTIEFRLNQERKMIAYVNGDRVEGYRCCCCNKIIITYDPY